MEQGARVNQPYIHLCVNINKDPSLTRAVWSDYSREFAERSDYLSAFIRFEIFNLN